MTPLLAAGNLTYDGLYGYTYDAWNRLAKVETAFRWDNGTLQNTSTVGIIQYDGLGRRTVKQIGDGRETRRNPGDSKMDDCPELNLTTGALRILRVIECTGLTSFPRKTILATLISISISRTREYGPSMTGI